MSGPLTRASRRQELRRRIRALPRPPPSGCTPPRGPGCRPEAAAGAAGGARRRGRGDGGGGGSRGGGGGGGGGGPGRGAHRPARPARGGRGAPRPTQRGGAAA